MVHEFFVKLTRVEYRIKKEKTITLLRGNKKEGIGFSKNNTWVRFSNEKRGRSPQFKFEKGKYFECPEAKVF